jgi:hypothetical protein
MKTPNELQALHQQLIKEIREETNAEMAENMAEMQAESIKAQGLGSCDLNSLDLAGLDTKKLEKLERQTTEADDEEFAEMDRIMAQQSEGSFNNDELDLESSFLPEGGSLLTPSWSEVFSDNLDQNELVQSNEIDSQAVVGGGSCKNSWNWARGSGWGCSGGTGSNTQIVKWGFWFYPTQSRFYSIKPRFLFNGYYIAKANDKWYNCKSTQLQVAMRTRVHQYNWKSLNSVNILNINSQHININKRLDDARFTNYNALLGKNDWAYIECSVKLYVKAQGSGSYAKNDFSTGANKVCVPYVIVT